VVSGGDVPVDLVVNCFERSYRHVLAPGFFPEIRAMNRRGFACTTAVINNVDDVDDATRRAAGLVERGEIDRFVFVADHVRAACAQCGVSSQELGAFPYFTDFALVAVTLDGPDWFVLWDADVRLREPVDWVSPSIALMDRDPTIMTANPDWPDLPHDEWFERHVDGFGVGQGFSDQVFMGRRSAFGRPIYTQRCVCRWRYPLSHIANTFEARVDAHMRHANRVRATFRAAVYEHGVEMGASWPHRTVGDRFREARNQLVIDLLRHAPWRPHHLRQI
jgi:hypothetical protein